MKVEKKLMKDTLGVIIEKCREAIIIVYYKKKHKIKYII